MNTIISRPQRVLAVFIAAALSATSLSTQAFDVPVHTRITRGELRPLRADIDGKSKGFSQKALEQIADANEAVDSISTGSAALFKPERHFTNEAYRNSSQRLVALRREIVQLVTAQRRDGKKARDRLGQALHTLQDFYAHSNWVERGNTGISQELGKSVVNNPAAASRNCPGNPNTLGPSGGGSLTSGYFVGFTMSRDTFGCDVDELPANKCFHGNYRPTCIGINKDLDAVGAAQNNVPQNPFHPAASRQARDATRVFVQGILDELEGNDRALAALLDVKGTLGFVVDDTGSMGSSIAGVVGTINQIVDEVGANPDLKPDEYMLVRYGDPDVGSPLLTEDAAVLRSAVAGLSPHGGGDCPELSQSALVTAVDAAAHDSRVYLFTDATAKDSGAMNQVIALAQAKGTELNYALTGSCSPIDPAYIRGSAETGGQLFRVNPSEIPKLFAVIRPQLKGDLATITRRRVDLGTGGNEIIEVPVDARMSGLLVSLTVVENNVAARHVVKVYRPSGVQVSVSDPGVQFVTLSSGAIVHVDAPEPGQWRVDVEGYGPFTATVQGNSPIDLARFDFVAPGGDIHGGFDPIAGQPVMGSSDLAEATMAGSFTSAEFNFIDVAGNDIGPLELSRNYPTADAEHFLGTSALPAVPFRIAVSGTDGTGIAYRREYPTVYRTQPIKIGLDGLSVVSISPGVPKEMTYVVENRGPAGAFNLAASDERDYVLSISPSSLALATGEKANVIVTLRAPENAADGETSAVLLTATKQGAPDVFNSASAIATVVANQAPICSTTSSQVLVWPPNGKFKSVSINETAGVTDPDGDAVSISIQSITQDEPVAESGRTGSDASGIGSDVASIRAERLGGGNGRVYEVRYIATDTHGAGCSGSVYVGVPHDRSDTSAIDDGQLFDSTVP